MAIPDVTTMYHGMFPRRVPYMLQGGYAPLSIADIVATPGTGNALLIERIEWIASATFSVTTPISLTPMLPSLTGLEFTDLNAWMAASSKVSVAASTLDTPLKGTMEFRPPIVLRDSLTEVLTIHVDGACVVAGLLNVTICGWLLPETDLGDIFA